MGDLTLANGQKVDGVFDEKTKKITVKADGIVRGYDQLLEHEVFHAISSADPTVRAEVKDSIVRRFSREEFQRIAEEYARNLGAVYAVDADMIEDEVMADAYAGMNRFADADATEFTDTAQETVMAREIAGNGQNEAATMETTGPPMRYSINRTRSLSTKDQFSEYRKNNDAIIKVDTER